MNIREWGNPIFGLPGDLQGFVRIELVSHHSYGKKKLTVFLKSEDFPQKHKG